MYDFSLYGDIYLRKNNNKRSTEPTANFFSFAQSMLENNAARPITIFQNKQFSNESYASAFNRSYCLLYVEFLSFTKEKNDLFVMEVIHLPRLNDHSRAVHIVIEFNDHKINRSTISTVRGTDDDIWYFLIQLADFHVMSKFKRASGISL